MRWECCPERRPQFRRRRKPQYLRNRPTTTPLQRARLIWVSGESMVYLPSGMRAVMLTPTVDFYTGEQTDASLAEELPALFEELSGFDMNTVIFNTDHDGVKCYDLEMDSGRGALGAAIDSAHENGFNAYVQLDVDSLIDDVTAQGGGLKSGFAAGGSQVRDEIRLRGNPAGELLH